MDMYKVVSECCMDSSDTSHLADMSPYVGQWLKTNEFSKIDEGKLLAPGNLRATQDNAGYAELFNYWVAEKYQLRYTGGMVRCLSWACSLRCGHCMCVITCIIGIFVFRSLM